MSEIDDLFGEYADPWRKKRLKEMSENKKAPEKRRSTGPKENIWSYCGSNWAWHSSDDGKTWQCRENQE